MTVSHSDLRAWTAGLLAAAGHRPDDADAAADIFVRATLRGIGHHDISYLPNRLKWIMQDGVNPRPDFTCFNRGPAFESWDADHALGELACRHATLRAIELSRTCGTGFATVRRSNHFLAAAPYAELGVEAGCLVLVWSNTDAGMSSPDGTRNFIGNNPMGFGLGVADHPPINFDSCVAYSSLGNLKALQDQDRSIPAWWGVDRSGQPTTSPADILEGGSVHPLGGHKGFGMALMHECLTGLLGQGTTFDHVVPVGGVNTHNQAVLAFNLEAFGGRELLESRARDLVDRMKAREPGLRLPGERSARTAAAQREHGVVLDPAVGHSLADWSARLGVTVPAAIQAALAAGTGTTGSGKAAGGKVGHP